jgi:hypothetical protein
LFPPTEEVRMHLNVDDFGCVPDGRYLERVSIDAGSVELTAEDGTLRGTDVGKQIAIPGAVDLVATIAELLDRKDVEHASMQAGSAVLTAFLTPEDGFFRADLHTGLRITVVGAGEDGATLVSDVLQVTGPTTLELTEPAATTVPDAVAVLNLRDRVALSDYARATATDVSVTLRDRVVTDARMIVGQRGLVSGTAGFSSLDLGTVVTIRGAGRLVTTIEAVSADTKASLSAPGQRPVSNGTADVWKTDSRPGFQSLLDELASLDIESADIHFSPGVYDFRRLPPGPNVPPGAISLRGLRNLTLRGGGAGVTIVRLMPDQDLKGPDTHVVEARNCTNLTIRDLTVYGAYLTLDRVNEQMHGIAVNQGCEDVVVDHVEVFQTAGDGIRLLGEATNKVRRVWLESCRLIQNKRTGVAFQRAVELVWMHDCYIEMTPPSTDSCIDFEPSGQSAPTDVIIDSNVLVHGNRAAAVSISGIAGTDPARRIQFTRNSVVGGGIGGVHAEDVSIVDNRIVAGDAGQVAVFRGSFGGLRVVGNTIIAEAGERDGIRLVPLDGFNSSNVRITGNNIATAGTGILLTDPGSHIEIRGNRILGRGAADGVLLRLTGPSVTAHNDIRIVANTIANFGDAGIRLSTANTSERFEGLEIRANEISAEGDATTGLVGIRFAAPGSGGGRWVERAVVSENRIADAVPVKIERHGPTVPFLTISGNAGDRAIMEGDGNPNGLVSAPPGSLFIQIDVETAAALYLKATGHGDSGWVEIATVGP